MVTQVIVVIRFRLELRKGVPGSVAGNFKTAGKDGNDKWRGLARGIGSPGFIK
jgi:hypothetical protein